MNCSVRKFIQVTLCAIVVSGGLSSCVGTSVRTRELMDERRAQIASEPRGDYYIGRRYWVMQTQFWGYIRRPGESWDNAKLVIMNEKRHRRPDHNGISPFGYDNNFEYRVWGHFSGDRVYDPNSDLILPEFVLENIELKSARPGFLFHPEESRSTTALLRMP